MLSNVAESRLGRSRRLHYQSGAGEAPDRHTEFVTLAGLGRIFPPQQCSKTDWLAAMTPIGAGSVTGSHTEEVLVSNSLLIRRKRRTSRIPPAIWKHNVRSEAKGAGARLKFMGSAHHLVRTFVVTELPRAQQSLSPETIAVGVGLEIERVLEILDELEEQLTFLYRRDGRNVDWAYPVTVEETPHRVTLDSGERFFGA